MPVKNEFLKLVQIAGDVLEGSVCNPWAPGKIEATQLAQVLGHELDAVVGDLGAAREAECGQVGQAVYHVHHAMVGDLPAGVQAQCTRGAALLGGEVGHRRVGHMVRLQAQLAQIRQELRDRRYSIVGHIDAVADAQRREPSVQTRPQARLGEVVTARKLQV